MIGVVLVSHGEVAAALVSAATMILGDQQQLVPVSFAPGMTPEALSDALNQAIAAADRDGGVLLLADLFGGTPARVIAEHVLLRGMPAVAGVNLPMLLEVCCQREAYTLDQLRKIAYENGRAGVVDIGACLGGS